MTTLFLFHSTKANHMSKINSGILGPFSGQLSNIIGYRRLGSNIVQTKTTKKKSKLKSTALSNAKKLKQISNYFAIVKYAYFRECDRIGMQKITNMAIIFSQNLSHWIDSDNLHDNYLLFIPANNFYQPTSIVVKTQYPNTSSITRYKRNRTTNLVGSFIQTRTRYYSYNNFLQNLDTIQNTTDIVGSGTPWAATPSDQWIAQISTCYIPSIKWYSNMVFYAQKRP